MDQTDSPEILDRGDTSQIPRPPSGEEEEEEEEEEKEKLFYAQSTAKDHIRAKQIVLLPQVNILIHCSLLHSHQLSIADRQIIDFLRAVNLEGHIRLATPGGKRS